MRTALIVGAMLIAFAIAAMMIPRLFTQPDIDPAQLDAQRAEWVRMINECSVADVIATDNQDPLLAILDSDPDMSEPPADIITAADVGDADAMAVYAVLRTELNYRFSTQDEIDETAQMLFQSARAGSVFGMREWGQAMRDRRFNDIGDTDEAQRYLSRAAAAGDAASFYYLGEMYRDGETRQNPNDSRSLEDAIRDYTLRAAALCYSIAISDLAYEAGQADSPHHDPEWAARLRAVTDAALAAD